MPRQTPLQTLGFYHTFFFFPVGKNPKRLSSNGEVETKKTLPDGSTAKISERTVRRETGFGDLGGWANVLWAHRERLIGYQQKQQFYGELGQP